MVVKVYISGSSGNKAVKANQRKSIDFLTALGVKLDVIDISQPELAEERDFMLSTCKPGIENVGKLPLCPQFFNDQLYCGGYDDFDCALENDTITEFLKLSQSDMMEGKNLPPHDWADIENENEHPNGTIGGKDTEIQENGHLSDGSHGDGSVSSTDEETKESSEIEKKKLKIKEGEEDDVAVTNGGIKEEEKIVNIVEEKTDIKENKSTEDEKAPRESLNTTKEKLVISEEVKETSEKEVIKNVEALPETKSGKKDESSDSSSSSSSSSGSTSSSSSSSSASPKPTPPPKKLITPQSKTVPTPKSLPTPAVKKPEQTIKKIEDSKITLPKKDDNDKKVSTSELSKEREEVKKVVKPAPIPASKKVVSKSDSSSSSSSSSSSGSSSSSSGSSTSSSTS